MIYYIAYTSTPVEKPTEKVFNQITDASKRWNPMFNITGILICMEDRFFQFLEGDETNLNDLLKKIKADSRHTDITVRVKGFENNRIFKEWSMASWMLSNKEIINLTAVQDIQNYFKTNAASSRTSEKFLNMMQNILTTWLQHEADRFKKLGKSE